MAQLHAACDHLSNQQEHLDYASGSIVSAIYNVNRDTKKYGMVLWWEVMPRWTLKYKLKQQLAQEEELKAYFYALKKAQQEQVQ